MEAKAILRNAKVSPQKARLVADLVRGKSVKEAVAILSSTVKRAAYPMKKVIESAAANAVNNNKMNEENLVISKLFVDEGRKLKRTMPMGKGSASLITKRSSHITVVVTEKE